MPRTAVRFAPRAVTAAIAVVFALATALPGAASSTGPGAAPGAASGAEGGPKLTVMSRNLYLGTSLNRVVAAQSQQEFIAAVTQSWATVVATDFPARAEALADEIAATEPDVVGLQEVSLWREQLVSDAVTGQTTPNATDVVYDFLAILRAELAAQGTPYTPVSTSRNADVEAPRANAASPNGFTDIRLTDRDVILVRTPLVHKAANPKDDRFQAQLTVPTAGGPVTFTRGWAAIDYRHSARHTVRIINTHLEVANPPAAGAVQVAQGDELLDVANASPHPLVVLGDVNSAADGSSTPTYVTLTAQLSDAWSQVHPSDPGFTCCQGERLDDPAPKADQRIDVVLSSGDIKARTATLTGDTAFRDVPAPLWASDHYGVVARLELSAR